MSDDATSRAKALQRQAAKAEQRLIERAERAEKELGKARRRLVDAEARLTRAQNRAQRRRLVFQAAETAVREAQAARVAGPPPTDTPSADGVEAAPLQSTVPERQAVETDG